MKFDSSVRGTGGRGSGKADFHRGGGGGEQRDSDNWSQAGGSDGRARGNDGRAREGDRRG